MRHAGLRLPLLTVLLLGAGFTAAGEQAIALPELPGFITAGEPSRFDPDTLYEYINGDALSYLSYGFEELAVQEYGRPEGGGLVLEIYRHRDANNGFGIYSYEKPPEGNFYQLGGEGYFDAGAVNFFKGAYYVKLEGNGLGDGAEALLRSAAEAVAAALPGKAGFPRAVRAFPAEGLRESSLRYVGESLLGHSFLRSGFVADYETENGDYRAFIADAGDAAAARKMLAQYRELLEKKGEPYVEEEGTLRFLDPYHKYEGRLHLRLSGASLFGVFLDDPEVADRFLKAVEANLAAPA
jgi:hypothetical protein